MVLTRRDDVEDAGVSLLADGVAAPAHERAVLQGAGRGEGQHGPRAVAVDETLLDLLRLGRVVEGPSVRAKK